MIPDKQSWKKVTRIQEHPLTLNMDESISLKLEM